jgi:hypothetical protein
MDRVPLYEGYLTKEGQWRHSMKERYFRLYDDKTLQYFADKVHILDVYLIAVLHGLIYSVLSGRWQQPHGH